MVARYGLFGGSFDPPHRGHLEAARAAAEQLELTTVIWVPTNQNPLRTTRPFASGRDRMQMVAIAIEGEPNMAVSDIEIQRGGDSYSLDTVLDFKRAQPGDYWWLVGSDLLADVPRWHRSDRLIEAARLAAFPRAGYDIERANDSLPEPYKLATDIVQMQPISVSSTEIRDSIIRDMDVRRDLLKGVLKYIEESDCYSR